MRQFLEMLRVKKFNLSGMGGVFPYNIEYFPYGKNLDLLFGLSGIC